MWIFPKDVVIIDRQQGTQYNNRPMNLDNIVTFDDSTFNAITIGEDGDDIDNSNSNSGHHIVHEKAPRRDDDGIPSIEFKLSNGESLYWVYPTDKDRDADLDRITETLMPKKSK